MVTRLEDEPIPGILDIESSLPPQAAKVRPPAMTRRRLRGASYSAGALASAAKQASGHTA